MYLISSCSGGCFIPLGIKHVRISDINYFTWKVVRYPFKWKEIFCSIKKEGKTKKSSVALKVGFQRHKGEGMVCQFILNNMRFCL